MKVEEPSARYLSGGEEAKFGGADGIPEDWGAQRLNDLGVWKGGATPSMQNPKYWGGTIPWASSGDIKKTRISDTELRITDLAVKQSSTTVLPGNSILVVTRSGILRKYLPVAKSVVRLAINQDIKGLIVDPAIESEFLLFALEYAGPSILASCQKAGTTVESIEFQWLKDFRIPLPGKTEQRAIAEALSDVDELLGALEALIAKKRAIKQATVEQLLTGKTRLPGFSGQWETKRLGDLCTLKSGEAITSESINSHSSYPCYGGNGLRGFTRTYTHDGNHALIGRQGALCGNVVGVSGRFYASEHALVVTPEANVDIRWLTFVLGRMNLNQYSESSAQPGLSAAKLLVIGVNAPATKEEQTAIATGLSDMDAEIAALEARREKTRALKQGMMQQLLTGRVRLVQPGQEEAVA